ncbi:hypothetical protein AAC387_Pa01g0864 [Persea americana]
MAFLCQSKLFLSSFPPPDSMETVFLKLLPFKISNTNRNSQISLTVRSGPCRFSSRPMPTVSTSTRQESELQSSLRCCRTPIPKPPLLHQTFEGKLKTNSLTPRLKDEFMFSLPSYEDGDNAAKLALQISACTFSVMAWLIPAEVAHSSEELRGDMIYEIGELFELGIQLSYLLILLGLLGVGTFFVIRQVLVRRELDLSAKELQEQVRSGDASSTGYFELGAVMLRRKFYPAAIKYLQQAIEKWDGDDQDLAQVYNALGVSYVRDGKLDKGITQFERAVKLQPGYVTAWNNLGDAYEKKKDLRAALKAFEEVLLFDPNNKVARPRRDALKERVQLYKGVSLKSEERSSRAPMTDLL